MNCVSAHNPPSSRLQYSLYIALLLSLCSLPHKRGKIPHTNMLLCAHDAVSQSRIFAFLCAPFSTQKLTNKPYTFGEVRAQGEAASIVACISKIHVTELFQTLNFTTRISPWHANRCKCCQLIL